MFFGTTLDVRSWRMAPKTLVGLYTIANFSGRFRSSQEMAKNDQH